MALGAKKRTRRRLLRQARSRVGYLNEAELGESLLGWRQFMNAVNKRRRQSKAARLARRKNR